MRDGPPAKGGAETAAPAREWLRHGPGFLISGLAALTVDMGVTSLMTRWAGLPPLSARLIAIACAMVVAWSCHRRFTFRVTVAPTFAEFGRYVLVASSSVATNYAFFALVLWVLPELAPELALVMSSICAMAVSYFGMRFGVFEQPPKPGHDDRNAGE